jgi:hypothetical protein
VRRQRSVHAHLRCTHSARANGIDHQLTATTSCRPILRAATQYYRSSRCLLQQFRVYTHSNQFCRALYTHTQAQRSCSTFAHSVSLTAPAQSVCVDTHQCSAGACGFAQVSFHFSSMCLQCALLDGNSSDRYRHTEVRLADRFNFRVHCCRLAVYNLQHRVSK